MKQFEGKIIMKIPELSRTGYSSPEEAALGTEIFLNGEIASQIFNRFGVSIRVHIGEEVKVE